ncbi:MAG: methionine synthase [Candidatus Berkiellales bacterium]
MNVERKKRLSDEAVDAIAAVIIIAAVVSGVVFWLYGMPT